MKNRDGEDYLKQHPRLQRWVNTCVLCGCRGHRPEMRDEDFHAGIAAINIRTFFPAIAIDENGHCSDWARKPAVLEKRLCCKLADNLCERKRP